jgi:phosphotriesterase-related protein
MTEIQTVRGPVSHDQLGPTLIHEYVLFQYDDSRRKESIDFQVKLLQDGLAHGIQTYVELTPKRRIDWFMEINNRVDVNIIASTGYYVEQMTAPPLAALSEAQMVERMVQELRDGIDALPVKAGIIKVAGNTSQLTSWEVQVFTAAAKAQRRTGACIATHAIAGAREQADVLLRGGADLNRVFFSHVEAEFGWDRRTIKEEAAYLEKIARQGGSLLFNNFGFEWDTPWPDLIYLLKHLCDAGLQEKVLISMDVNWTWDKNGKIEFEAEVDHPGAERRTYAYMMTDAVPALIQAGFTQKDIDIFLIDNPRMFFSRAGSPV